MAAADPFYAPGSGLTPQAADGGKFLSYADLKAQKPLYEHRDATREIELRLTGNMERYIWSINDVKYSDAEPIRLRYGERVRFKFVNETMMTHPMHLHGQFFQVVARNGTPVDEPFFRDTVLIKRQDTVDIALVPTDWGRWMLHCHILEHAEAGMMALVEVGQGAAH